MTVGRGTGELPPGRPARSPVTVAARAAGVLVAALAAALCGRTLVDSWHGVRVSLGHAAPGWLVLGLAASTVAMTALALAWWRSLRLFGEHVEPGAAVSWYFAGEFGKYVPGGVWSLLGRGELAARDGGVRRSLTYGTTLLSYATMCLAAGVVCGVCGPVAALAGSAPQWWWALALLVPLSAFAVHPRVLASVLAIARRIMPGRVAPDVPTRRGTAQLVAWSVPAWLALGVASVAITQALGVDQSPVRVAFAAVAAWIVGFLAVPVPAGAGVRELVFVGTCGLPSGPAVAVAVIARVSLVLVDAAGGLGGLGRVALTARHRERPVRTP